jgi:hypothetical protein
VSAYDEVLVEIWQQAQSQSLNHTSEHTLTVGGEYFSDGCIIPDFGIWC